MFIECSLALLSLILVALRRDDMKRRRAAGSASRMAAGLCVALAAAATTGPIMYIDQLSGIEWLWLCLAVANWLFFSWYYMRVTISYRQDSSSIE